MASNPGSGTVYVAGHSDGDSDEGWLRHHWDENGLLVPRLNEPQIASMLWLKYPVVRGMCSCVPSLP